MTTRERTQARNDNQKAAQYTELWIIGTPEETTALVHALRTSGRLVQATAPTIAGPHDPRHRRYLRLRNR
ncbi:hypothetical protein [Actinoplanes sp. TFC3]|uniref:hypothetical protein n=1 Tax=Actinoplanes sp. TFC3 TaxID=1710355 RepID=UPI00082A12F2|nr:hypothetical protein [Actinoplanes sp. TFC3]